MHSSALVHGELKSDPVMQDISEPDICDPTLQSQTAGPPSAKLNRHLNRTNE
jgi:hypothetical protein